MTPHDVVMAACRRWARGDEEAAAAMLAAVRVEALVQPRRVRLRGRQR